MNASSSFRRTTTCCASTKLGSGSVVPPLTTLLLCPMTSEGAKQSRVPIRSFPRHSQGLQLSLDRKPPFQDIHSGHQWLDVLVDL